MINEALATLDDITHWAPPGSCARLHMLRLDCVHPVVSGNKWYKLKYNAAAAKAEGKDTLLTFGGGYSNHLAATAYAAKEWDLKSVGIIRGYYEGEQLTPTLQQCLACGMQLLPLTKAEYALQQGADEWTKLLPSAYVIPEGGANEAGIRGAADIATLIPPDATDVCVAMGTGTTLNGLYRALPAHMKLHGFYVARDIARAGSLLSHPAIEPAPSLRIHGVKDQRFGKWSDEAVQFIRSFYGQTGIMLDVVYTSKMMMKVCDLLQERFFDQQGRIVCIHTGGLQGNPAGLFP
jgi:1-aminocyclopropane-1-carboxylate deaminase